MNAAIGQTAAVRVERSPLGRNVGALYALQAVSYLLPLVTVPYLIGTLGVDGFGVISFAYALVLFMVLFVDAGFNTLATRRLAQPDLKLSRIRDIYAATQWIKAVQCVSMAGLLLALVGLIPSLGGVAPVYLATFPIVIGTLLFPTWLFQGLEIMHVTTCCGVAGRVVASTLIFACVTGPDDLVLAAFLQAMASVLSGAFALPFLARLGISPFVAIRRLRREVRYTLGQVGSLAPAEYLANVAANCGVFVLGLFSSESAVGIYAAVEKVARAAAGLFQPLIRGVLPALSRDWSVGSVEARRIGVRWTVLVLVLAFIVAATLCALAPLALELAFGPSWRVEADLLRAQAAWLGCSVAATVSGQFWLLAPGRPAAYACCLMKGSVVLLAASLLGAWVGGALGLIAAASAAEVVLLCMFVAAARRFQWR